MVVDLEKMQEQKLFNGSPVIAGSEKAKKEAAIRHKFIEQLELNKLLDQLAMARYVKEQESVAQEQGIELVIPQAISDRREKIAEIVQHDPEKEEKVEDILKRYFEKLISVRIEYQKKAEVFCTSLENALVVNGGCSRKEALRITAVVENALLKVFDINKLLNPFAPQPAPVHEPVVQPWSGDTNIPSVAVDNVQPAPSSPPIPVPQLTFSSGNVNKANLIEKICAELERAGEEVTVALRDVIEKHTTAASNIYETSRRELVQANESLSRGISMNDLEKAFESPRNQYKTPVPKPPVAKAKPDDT